MAEPILASGDGPTAPLHIERHIHARPSQVFDAWRSAESVSRWFAPADLTVHDCRIECREGGVFALTMRMPDGSDPGRIDGVFLEVVENQRLVILMKVSDEAGSDLFEAHTTIVFEEAFGGTRLTVTQAYLLLDPARAGPMTAGAAQGWASTLDKLGEAAMAARSGDAQTAPEASFDTFHIERAYDVAPNRLWAALTDPEAKAKWFAAPNGEWELVERRMDVRPGGSEVLEGRWRSGLISRFEATYLDVVDGQRLVYAYQMWLDGRKISVSLATMQVIGEAGGARTSLKVTEQGVFLGGYADAGAREHGTGLLLDALGASLA